jgi:hypothetical protein
MAIATPTLGTETAYTSNDNATKKKPVYIRTCKLTNMDNPLVYAACRNDDVDDVNAAELIFGSLTSFGDANIKIRNVVILLYSVCMIVA